MTARELIIQLQQFEPDTEVWLPAMTRKGIPTYAALDHIELHPKSWTKKENI